MERNNNHAGFKRRDFIKLGTLAGAGVALAGLSAAGCSSSKRLSSAAPQELLAVDPLPKVRVGFVGVGHQGTSHVSNFIKIDKVEIKAICDIIPGHAQRAARMVSDAGRPEPVLYTGGDDDFVRMCEQEELDLVFTATPWRWHVPVMVTAMKNGKHAATEVPAALTLDECWQLVETAEKYRKHCVMMENCNYDRTELMILNMARQGLLGELLHAECGYLHDLRELKLTDFYQGNWRVEHSKKRNADLYPTHGLGPVAQWMDINRGNQFDYLVSMSSPGRGLNLWAEEHYGRDHPLARQKYALGDVVNTMIKTKKGQTIIVTHDTNTPRPYSRKILLQGTKGLVRKYPEQKIHLQGISPAHHWEDLNSYYEKYEHPLWAKMTEMSAGAGHGGMDFIEDYRLVQCLLEGQATDMNVYDAVAVSAVVALSEQSIASGSKPVEFPDFTRGRWKEWPQFGIVS